MDASQITKLLQKQNTRYINRSQTVDSSTLTWQNQIQSAKYIKGNIPTQADTGSSSAGVCSYGGQGKDTSLATGSTQRYPSVYAGASGSASQVYSSEQITLQKAGIQACAAAPTVSYTVLPECYCINTNGPTSDNPTPSINNNITNPYLPAFDTFYQNKTRCVPVEDQHQQHFVMQCHTRFPDAKNGTSLCTDCQNDPNLCDGCVASN